MEAYAIVTGKVIKVYNSDYGTSYTVRIPTVSEDARMRCVDVLAKSGNVSADVGDTVDVGIYDYYDRDAKKPHNGLKRVIRRHTDA